MSLHSIPALSLRLSEACEGKLLVIVRFMARVVICYSIAGYSV